MDAWAALVALYEAYEAGLADGAAGVDDLDDDLNRVMDVLDEFDKDLARQTALLSLAASTPLLDNWRSWLAPEFLAEQPWWLDGRLEEAARRVEALASAACPSPEQLARLRRQRGLARHTAYPSSVLPAQRQPAFPVAADVAHPLVPGPGETLCWVSPDGQWRAELHLPAWSDPLREELSRPVVFTARADDAPATVLDGQPVRLGRISSVLARARFPVTLAQLRQAGELRLEVGEPAQVWEVS
jgi:hypothetical protein